MRLGLVIQIHILSLLCCDDQHHSGRFTDLIMEGCVNTAPRYLAPAYDCGPLSLDHFVGFILMDHLRLYVMF